MSQFDQGLLALDRGNSHLRLEGRAVVPARSSRHGHLLARSIMLLLRGKSTYPKTALGRHEARDRSWLMDWLKRDGRSLGDPSKTPWCGDFVETCIHTALTEEPLLGALGSNPYWARNWLLFGREVQPVTGAVLVFERGSGGHVGFAMGQDDTYFYVLGGNQSDAVTIARIAKVRLLGARWPATYSPRPERLPTMKPGEYLTTTNEI